MHPNLNVIIIVITIAATFFFSYFVTTIFVNWVAGYANYHFSYLWWRVAGPDAIPESFLSLDVGMLDLFPARLSWLGLSWSRFCDGLSDGKFGEVLEQLNTLYIVAFIVLSLTFPVRILHLLQVAHRFVFAVLFLKIPGRILYGLQVADRFVSTLLISGIQIFSSVFFHLCKVVAVLASIYRWWQCIDLRPPVADDARATNQRAIEQLERADREWVWELDRYLKACDKEDAREMDCEARKMAAMTAMFQDAEMKKRSGEQVSKGARSLRQVDRRRAGLTVEKEMWKAEGAVLWLEWEERRREWLSIHGAKTKALCSCLKKK